MGDWLGRNETFYPEGGGSCYALLINKGCYASFAHSWQVIGDAPFALIWLVQVLPMMVVLIWIAFRGKLNSENVLDRKGAVVGDEL